MSTSTFLDSWYYYSCSWHIPSSMVCHIILLNLHDSPTFDIRLDQEDPILPRTKARITEHSSINVVLYLSVCLFHSRLIRLFIYLSNVTIDSC